MRITAFLFTIGLAIGLAGCVSNLPRQDVVEYPELVTITGSRVPQPAVRLQRVPGTAYPLYIVTRDDIRRTGATDTGNALDDLPFLEIRR